MVNITRSKIISVIMLILIFAGSSFWWRSLPQGTETVNIERGFSAKQSARLLKEKGLIRSEYLFVFFAKVLGISDKLKAGVYVLPKRSSVFHVLNMLAKGRSRFYRITVPEGFTAAQIAEVLSFDGVADKEIFIGLVKEQGLEGFLFPETYYFDPDTSEAGIIKIMNDEYRKRFSQEMKDRAAAIKMNEREAVTLASIIEREAYIKSEKPLISAVFHNRLKKRWYLESCATILYALGKHKERLLYRDLKIDSPYNTYRNLGLPPGPICSPGMDSINAALYPSNSDEMFFVVASSGTHTFSRYLKEHIKNKKVLQNAKKKNLSRP